MFVKFDTCKTKDEKQEIIDQINKELFKFKWDYSQPHNLKAQEFGEEQKKYESTLDPNFINI